MQETVSCFPLQSWAFDVECVVYGLPGSTCEANALQIINSRVQLACVQRPVGIIRLIK